MKKVKMVRVLCMSFHDRMYYGSTATEIIEWLRSRSFLQTRDVDNYVQRVASKLVGKKYASQELSKSKTTEERCESFLELITKLKIGAVVKKGSQEEKNFLALLRKKLTPKFHTQIYISSKQKLL